MAPDSRKHSAKMALLTDERYALCAVWRQLVQIWPHDLVSLTRNSPVVLKIFPRLEAIWLRAETNAPFTRLLDRVDELAIRDSRCHLIVCVDEATPTEMAELLAHGVDEILFLAGVMAEPLVLQKTLIALNAQWERREALKNHITRHQKALQSKTDFLAWLSHEIRTPMNGVLGMVDLLPQEGLSSEQQDMIEVMGRSGRRVVDLLSEVLDVSRFEAGKMTRHTQDFGLRRLIEDSISLYARDANQRGLIIGNLVDADVPDALRGDERKLSQILNNLISNAVKYTSAGHVLIKASVEAWEESEVSLLIEVQDSGHGIAAEELPKVFAPFEQTDSSQLSHSPSSGLGLSLTKNLVELLGGDIRLSSQLGEGSTFSCRLPFEVQEQMVLPIRNVKPLQRAVVVSRNPDRVHVLRQMLERGGITVSIGGSSEPLPEADWYFFGEPHDWDNRAQEFSREARPRRVFVLRNPLTDRRLPWGCEFIDLPLKQSDLYRRIHTDLVMEPMSQRPAWDFQGARILVVDDDPVNLRVAERQLKRLRADTTLASSGVDALECLEKKHFDLVFVDCQMPHMDGFELVRILRGMPQVIPGTPVIALTALGRDEDRERALQNGFTDFLMKPAQLEDIQKLLGLWLPHI